MTIQPEELAALSAATYRLYNQSTQVEVPSGYGWSEIARMNGAAGFEASAFQRGNEVVISFTGSDDWKDWVWANPLLAIGVPSMQLSQAAGFLEGIKSVSSSNPNATFTLTGHSLGGGLAAVLGAYFHIPTVAFDAAPFAASLYTDSVRESLLLTLAGIGVTEQSLLTGVPDSSFVTNWGTSGEILSYLSAARIGGPTTQIASDPQLALEPLALHSMDLLAPRGTCA